MLSESGTARAGAGRAAVAVLTSVLSPSLLSSDFKFFCCPFKFQSRTNRLATLNCGPARVIPGPTVTLPGLQAARGAGAWQTRAARTGLPGRTTAPAGGSPAGGPLRGDDQPADESTGGGGGSS